MNRTSVYVFFAFIVSMLLACNYQKQKTPQANSKVKAEKKPIAHHDVDSDDTTKICKCPAQFELTDSSLLTHIKDRFYESQTGHLYEKTIALRKVNGRLTEIEYFNGYFCQEVDPQTFTPLGGWYAKDKNNVYYYRPVSGGMQISKVDGADNKTFKLLQGHYKYAMDKNFFYDDTQIIEGFSPAITKQVLNNKGEVTTIICRNKKFKFYLVEHDK
jgi:hypothetical protein